MTMKKQGGRKKSILYPYRAFNKGEAFNFPDTDMPPEYSKLLKNCHVTPRGGIGKIPGYVPVNNTPVAETFKSGFEFKLSTGTTQLIAAGGGKIYKIVGTVITAIKTGLNATAKWSFAQINDLLIMTNGVAADGYLKYDGTTVAALGGSPPTVNGNTAPTVRVRAGRVWLLFPMIGYCSDLDEPEVWSGTETPAVPIQSITDSSGTATVTTTIAHGLLTGDNIQMTGADPPAYNGVFSITYVSTTSFTFVCASDPGGPAVDVGSYTVFPNNNAGFIDFKFVLPKGDTLLDCFTYVNLHVFTFRNFIVIYQGTTPSGINSDYSLVQIIEGCGVVASDSYQPLGTDAAFLFTSGIKSLRQSVTTGNMNLHDVSEAIDPDLQPDIAAGTNFSSGHYPALGWVLFLVNGTVRVYSYVWKAWGRIVGADIQGMFNGADGSLYLCGTGNIYKYGTTYSFNGIAPDCTWQTSFLALDRSYLKQYPKMLELLNYPGAMATISLTTTYDWYVLSTAQQFTFITEQNQTYIDNVTNWDALNPLDEVPSYPLRIPLFGSGRHVRFTFSNNSTVGPIEFNSMVIEALIGGM